MLNNRSKAYLWLTIIFALGVIVGSAVTYVTTDGGGSLLGNRNESQGGQSKTSTRDHPHRSVEEWVERLNSDADLRLDADQQTRLVAVVQATRERYSEEDSRHKKEFGSIRQESRDQIRKVLTQDQVTRFDKFLEERRAKRSSR